MYDKINITENSLKVLALFTKGFKNHHIREVQRLAGISPRTSQLILEDFENKGVLESENIGKTKVYKIRKNEISKRYIVLAEQYKTISLLEKNMLLKEIIERIKPSIKGIGILFGSYAKLQEKEDSDIDIFVIGVYDKENIKKVSNLLGKEIDVKCYPLKLFRKGIQTDTLIKEVIENHTLFSQAEQFIEEIL